MEELALQTPLAAPVTARGVKTDGGGALLAVLVTTTHLLRRWNPLCCLSRAGPYTKPYWWPFCLQTAGSCSKGFIIVVV